MQYKCTIIDDEPLAQEILEGYIKRIDFLELVTKTDSLQRVEDLVAAGDVDVVFLDINIRGTQRKSINRLLDRKCHFIIVTAYPLSFIEDIQLKTAHGYLSKPASFKDFLREIQRVLNVRFQ
ncbi:response regulator receiver domain-containing protein [Chitinophaga niastensis]|uniref:Response regulator receiver domain-containing protein n=1 Tax=Chitinophaga niastensis TaxID=536980 RepID=A0A2P8HTA3_CHINA|nr:response regulator [Chitinophaga niastensis]PSL49404.1 response regulator receiver domain-containing protein [Chitinophaga niastensis]